MVPLGKRPGRVMICILGSFGDLGTAWRFGLENAQESPVGALYVVHKCVLISFFRFNRCVIIHHPTSSYASILTPCDAFQALGSKLKSQSFFGGLEPILPFLAPPFVISTFSRRPVSEN